MEWAISVKYAKSPMAVSARSRLASEFARMIPPEFDVALGIRTVQR